MVLYAPDGSDISSPLMLESPCSNNEDEYKLLIIGLSLLYRGIHKLYVAGYFRLIIKQVKGEFALKRLSLYLICPKVDQIVLNIQFEHVSRVHNSTVIMNYSDFKSDIPDKLM